MGLLVRATFVPRVATSRQPWAGGRSPVGAWRVKRSAKLQTLCIELPFLISIFQSTISNTSIGNLFAPAAAAWGFDSQSIARVHGELSDRAEFGGFFGRGGFRRADQNVSPRAAGIAAR